VKSQYKSGKSVAKNPTVSISADDPRVAWNKINQTKSRQGAEVDIVGLDGKALIAGGTVPGNQSGSSVTQSKTYTQDTYTPPMNGLPQAIYNGQGPVVIVPTNPTDVTASWSGEDLVVQFNWDYANTLNKTVSQFILELTADGITKRTALNTFAANKTQTAQTVTLTKTLNTQTFGIFRTQITSICVLVADPLNNISETICAASVPTYTLDLTAPTITATGITSGYSVSYTTPTQSSYNSIEIVEYESNSLTEPTGVTYIRTYLGTINPANIIVHNFNKRWVKARFTSSSGLTTAYSLAYAITPTSPVSVDTEGPANVETVTTTGGLDTTGTIGFNGYADISWSSVTTGGIRGYRIRYRPITTPVSSYSYADSPGSGTAYRLSGLGAGLTYEIAVATYDEYNNTSTSYIAGSNVAISGTPFIGTNISTTGFFQAGISGTDTGTFKFGYGVDTGKRGLVFNANNYWYIDSAQSASLKIGGSTTNYISWNGSTFAIDGDITARSGSFTGNVLLNGGSLYAPGTGGSANSGIRTIFNSSGIAAYNASGGYTAMLTTPLANGAVFTTNAADIGGWTVDTNRIYKTSISGKGNIEIDSTNGYVAVSHSSISDSKAGINSPTNSLTDNVFWAGTYGPTSTSNPFRVTLGGKLYATGAAITGGSVTSTGALGTVTMDGDHDLISIASSGATSYLFPRNSNTYLTSASPFVGGDYSNIGNLNNNPYFSVGAGFVDRYGSTVNGIGIYTGAFTGTGTKPFLSATSTGIQIKASQDVAISLEPLTGTNPGIIMTSGSDTTVGAITIKEQQVILQAASSSDGTDSPYTSASKIVLGSNKVQIFGITAQGDADITRRVQTSGVHSGSRLGSGGQDLYPLGPYGRQRMVVQSEYTGELLRGMAVYYGKTTDPIGTNTPSDTTGVIGDLFVVY